MTLRKPFDDVDPARRRLMAKVKATDSKPEMRVRRMLHALGYRFRLHRRDLPGTPDIVFSGRKRVIFVHGCFWHRHGNCVRTTTPKTRESYWAAKFDANVERDARQIEALKAAGWQVLVVWECETKDADNLGFRLAAFLDDEPRVA